MKDRLISFILIPHYIEQPQLPWINTNSSMNSIKIVIISTNIYLTIILNDIGGVYSDMNGLFKNDLYLLSLPLNK